MKIYSVRDRLIDYYMPPFCADNQHQVMSSLAQTVNNQENMNAISQTPQHFELWQLGEVNDETGQLTEHREYICDLHTLIRPTRPDTGGQTTGPGARGGQAPPGRSQETTGAHPGLKGPGPGAPTTTAPTTPGTNQEAHRQPGGVPGN